MSTFETNNEIIIEWVDIKLREVCRCVGIFVNYLLLPRTGYKTETRISIPLPVLNYVIEELFNCKEAIKYNPATMYPEDFAIKTKRLLRQEIVEDVTISSEFVTSIWKYISFGVENLTEGLDFKSELERARNIQKRKYTTLSHEQIKEFKKKINDSSDEGIHNLVVKTVASYRRLKALIKEEKKSTTFHLSSFEISDNYSSDTMGVVLSEDDKMSLIEFGVHNKHLKKLKAIKTSLSEKFEKNKKNSDYRTFYKSECKALLEIQLEILEKISKYLKKSKIGVFIENRKKKIPTERTGSRELLDRIYQKSKSDADKWKRASLFQILMEDPSYEIRKPIAKGVDDKYETTEKWIRGDEDMGDDELKLTSKMIDEQYVNFQTKKVWKEFLETVYEQLKEKLEEVDMDEDLTKSVLKRISTKIKTRIDTYQTFVGLRECTDTFGDDVDNCILQSLVYLVVSISDWLETPTIGEQEMKTALKILLPNSLQDYIHESSRDEDEKFIKIFKTSLESLDLRVDKTYLPVVVSVLKKIKSLDANDINFIAFHNRAKYFSNSLLPK